LFDSIQLFAPSADAESFSACTRANVSNVDNTWLEFLVLYNEGKKGNLDIETTPIFIEAATNNRLLAIVHHYIMHGSFTSSF
jgi:hypothetical protein